MDASFQFPNSTADDPSDVATAIETARALWRQGDSQESLRWLRRAADSAEAEGNDVRALSLARAAADLQEQVRPSVSPPPPSRPPVAPKSAAPPSRQSVAPARSLSPMPSAQSATPASRTPVPPAPKLEPWTPPASTRADAPASATPVPAPAAPVSAPASVAPSSSPREKGRVALRVSVEVLSRNARTLLVRILDDDTALQPGAAEALLVPVEAGVDLANL
jgi:hypothetical protein